MLFTRLLIITAFVTGVFYSGFPYEIEEIISKRLKFGRFKLPKPFSCPLCMSFWLNIFYILCTNNVNLLNILACLLLALSTPALDAAFRLVYSALENLFIWLNEKINGL
jgi:hypothetical protein